MGELQVFSLVADPTWHSLIWAPTCFSCRAAKLSLFAPERLVDFGWVPYAILVTRSIACFWFLEAVTTWASHWLYLYPGSGFSLQILTETLKWLFAPLGCSIQHQILQFPLHVCITNSRLPHWFLFSYLFTISRLYICIMPFSSFLLLVPNLSGIPLVHNYELVKALKMRNPVLLKVLTREVNLARERGSGSKGWRALPNHCLQRCGQWQV